MAEVKWIKIVSNMFDNRKIKQIRKMPDGDAIIVIWLNILCLAGQVNDNGLVYFSKDIPYTDEMLATEFDRPINTIRLALKTFQQFEMVEIVNSILLVSNWEKYQSQDKLAALREYNREKKRESRAKQKKIAEPVLDKSLTSPRSPQTDNISISKSISNEKDIEDCKGKKKKQFKPPTIEEVTEYCKERNKGVNPQKWHDFYQAKGWMIGKNKMKDWKAAVRTWEQDSKSQNSRSYAKPKQQNKSAETGSNSSLDMDKVSMILHRGVEID